MSAQVDISLNGLSINDFINYSVPFTNFDDLATATQRIQKMQYGPPIYTGQMWDAVTIALTINVIPVAGDWNYSDFDSKVSTLKRAFDTKYNYLSTLRVARTGQVPRTVLGAPKSFLVDRLARKCTIQFVVPDMVWLAEQPTTVQSQINSSGAAVSLTSDGTTETYPTITINWSTSKNTINPNGTFFTYQIPITVQNYAQTTIQSFPIEITGYISAPTFTATAGSGGSIGAGNTSIKVTASRVTPSGSGVQTNALQQTVTTVASGSIGVIITTTPDAFQYNVYAGTLGSETLQTTIPQPAQAIQADGQYRYPATVTTTLTSIVGGGAAVPTTNQTGWNHAAVVSAGQAKADGSDVRVLIGGVPSPSQIINPNTANTKIWVLLDMGVSEVKTIYLQYGNKNPLPQVPVIPSQSNPSGTTSGTLVTNSTTPAPLPEYTQLFPISLTPQIDMTGSTNDYWTWGSQGFFDYFNTLRPGSWQPVSSVGVGYNWQQDNNVVHRGVLTTYSTPSGLINGDFALGNLTGWSTSGSVSVVSTNPRFGSYDTYSLYLSGAASATQTISVVAGNQYTINGYLWSDTANSTQLEIKDASNGTVLVSFMGSGGSFYDIFLNSATALPITFTAPASGSVQVDFTQTSGNGYLDDFTVGPWPDVAGRVPLNDPTNNTAAVMGLLHSAVGVNNRETPLNGWEINHPAGVTKVTHYGITAMAGSDYKNDNVLRLMAEDTLRPPTVIWGQQLLTYNGPVYYATAGSPRVDVISPSRLRARFEVNVTTPTAPPLNGDGSFVAIQGAAINMNTQYIVGVSFGPIQQFYDLNCVIVQNTPGDGDMLYIQTNLEEKASIQIDTKNKMAWHIDGSGNKQLRTSAISIDTLRPDWMQIHPGINTINYYEDVVGQIILTITYQDAYS